jgi:hypothetical protein
MSQTQKRTTCVAAAIALATARSVLGQPATTRPAGPPPVAPADSILSEYDPQAPPNPDPPPYSLLRFNEDYSYLSDPRNRTDPFDALKYIPLSATDPDVYLSLGGGVRERYEHFTAPGFGTPGQPVRNDYLIQRVTLDADLHLGDAFRVFVQGISGVQLGGSRAPSAIQNDAVDLQQAFGDFKLSNGSTTDPAYLIVRGGRFELSLGAGRLVATRAAPNIPFKFDGAQLIAAAGGGHLYAFLTKPGRENKYDFDDETPGQQFWGVYYTTPQLFGAPTGTATAMSPASANGPLRADIYYLGFKDRDARYANVSGLEERHTFGTRLFGKAGGFDYDVEPVVQTGRVGDRGVLAWTVGSSAGYSFDGGWRPRFGLNADIASGDTGHNGGGHFGAFNPLYFKSGYFNDASLVRPSNIIDVHPMVQLRPTDQVLVNLGSDVLWRYTTNDGIYGPGGNLELPAGNARGGSHYFATTAEASVQWELQRHLVWTASYVHVFGGNYVTASRGHDVDFVGSWLDFTW